MKDMERDEGYACCVMSIDIGIHHSGMSMSLLDEEYELHEIILITVTSSSSSFICQLYGKNE